jgi:hypothetical protein
MDLREALEQISEIRQQVARTETFRGYRAAPIAFSGLLAWVAAACQPRLVPEPEAAPVQYLILWFGAALLSLVVTGLFIGLHAQARGSVARSHTWLAVSQFLPSLAAGGLLTLVLYRHAPQTLWMLPGLWSILFGLGVFASYRLLPRATFWVGVHYLAAGAVCLSWAQGEQHAFSPWTMGASFGLGQFLAAAILYWTLERDTDGE